MRKRDQAAGRCSRLIAILAIGMWFAALPASAQNDYFYPHFLMGENWQTTITIINYSPQSVTCTTSFFNDNGAPLPVPFGSQAAASSRQDVLAPGGSVHVESSADPGLPAPFAGWAKSSCTGPVNASLLFRLFIGGVARQEAGVNALTAPKTTFITFAETQTGIAYANPSTSQTAQVTITVFSTAGQQLGTTQFALSPGQHGAANVGGLLGLGAFEGSVRIVSTVPIVSFSLNFEATAPGSQNSVFSSLPPGDVEAPGPYFFPHLVLGGNTVEGVWQTTLTYINSSAQQVQCTTSFHTEDITDAPNGLLPVSFEGGAPQPTRVDTLPPGGSVHVESTVGADLPETVQAWARTDCDGSVRASLLFRLYKQGSPLTEAGLNATTNLTTKFISFGERQIALALVNPTFLPIGVTATAFNTAGQVVDSEQFLLLPQQHIATNPFINGANFIGSVHITTPGPFPFVGLTLNFEAGNSVFSSLPPGELDSSTPLAGGL